MGKILTVEQSIDIVKQLKRRGKRIILVGGCFDILHPGHIEFLTKSKKQGDLLLIILESDRKVKELKGAGKPINKQQDRAIILSNLLMVDYVVTLPYFKTDQDYATLVKAIEPDIIAVTSPDPIIDLKKEYAKSVGGRLIEIMQRKTLYSTSKIVKKQKP